MESKEKTLLKNRQRSEVASLSVDKEELRKLCSILEERSAAAAEIEINGLNREELGLDKFDEVASTLRKSFKLQITVSGSDGEELYGTVEEVFNSPNFPDSIRSLYVDNEHVLKAIHNYTPANTFDLLLDFSKPAIYDASLLPQQGTPNRSNYTVQGFDATWVNGLFGEIRKFVEKRSSKWSLVHSHSVYDFLIWILGLPFAFWLCFKFSDYIDQSNLSTFVKNAIYVYVFLAALFLFRVLFHYLRWVCPLVEYRASGSRIASHRAFLGAILVAIVGTIITDVFKALF